MNRLRLAKGIAAGLACVGALPQVLAQVTAPANAASQPPGVSSPAVRATQNARAPEEMRPEKRPVPQITVPLKRRGASAEAPASSAPQPTRSDVDDEVARCRASESARERAACSALTGGRKPQAAPARGG
jgi:hypothetical protein